MATNPATHKLTLLNSIKTVYPNMTNNYVISIFDNSSPYAPDYTFQTDMADPVNKIILDFPKVFWHNATYLVSPNYKLSENGWTIYTILESNPTLADVLAVINTVYPNEQRPSQVFYGGEIEYNFDFPIRSEIFGGFIYRIIANVVDNDPTKTNTGMSFSDNQMIFWSGEPDYTWIILGNDSTSSGGSELTILDNGINMGVFSQLDFYGDSVSLTNVGGNKLRLDIDTQRTGDFFITGGSIDGTIIGDSTASYATFIEINLSDGNSKISSENNNPKIEGQNYSIEYNSISNSIDFLIT